MLCLKTRLCSNKSQFNAWRNSFIKYCDFTIFFLEAQNWIRPLHWNQETQVWWQFCFNNLIIFSLRSLSLTIYFLYQPYCPCYLILDINLQNSTERRKREREGRVSSTIYLLQYYKKKLKPLIYNIYCMRLSIVIVKIVS